MTSDKVLSHNSLPAKVCRPCNGTGKINSVRFKGVVLPCYECNGKGYVEIVKCIRCLGTGVEIGVKQ